MARVCSSGDDLRARSPPHRSVADAVDYAAAYHAALRTFEPPLKARAGLHFGPVILTRNAPVDVARGAKPLEVDGIAKPTAARVMALAIGGQTLLTQEGRAALGASTRRIVSHGHWRVKGVSEPLELFEIGDDLSPFVPPPDAPKAWRVVREGDHWLPVSQIGHNLPAGRDTFVGREADLAALASRLDGGARLVSVLGTAGTGKTRLAVQYGWTWLGEWPGGVWFCDLSEARNVEDIAVAVARALDLPVGKGDPVAPLGHAIAGRGRCLLILDNMEQVARHADETLGVWLDRASDARFVVTTREVLGVRGEVTFALAPLLEAEAIALFVTRARLANRDFVLADADRPAVTELVRLLDRLPLAIELAAARVRMMSPKLLLQRMSERFKLLSSAGGRVTRQATLRAALDWSWDLLSDDDKAGLGQLSVFEGGFTLEAAAAVLSVRDAWPEDVVQSLVDRSLVQRVAEQRFDLLVSVHEYAVEKLGLVAGAEAEVRHGAHYAGFGSEGALAALSGHGGVQKLADLTTERDNILAASRRAVRRGDGPVASAALQAAWAVLRLRGPASAGATLAAAVLGVAGLPPGPRRVAAYVHGSALAMLGRMSEARQQLEVALGLARALGDRHAEAVGLDALGSALRGIGALDEARVHYDRGLELAREAGDRSLEGIVLTNLGLLHARQGRPDEARRHYQQAAVVARAAGDRRNEGHALGNLANLAMNLARMDEARTHYAAALAVHVEVGNGRGAAYTLSNLGNLHLRQGRLEDASAQFEAALKHGRELGDRRFEGAALTSLGDVFMAQGRIEEARACLLPALAIGREVGYRDLQTAALINLGDIDRAQGRQGEARSKYDDALALAREAGDVRVQGIALGCVGELQPEAEARASYAEAERLLRACGEVIELARLLCRRARLEWAHQRPEAGLGALSEAEALTVEAGAGARSQLGQDLAAARAVLGSP